MRWMKTARQAAAAAAHRRTRRLGDNRRQWNSPLPRQVHILGTMLQAKKKEKSKGKKSDKKDKDKKNTG